MISVSGGLVVPGGIRVDLIHRKVDEVKNLFYRIIEMQLNLPFGKGGSAKRFKNNFVLGFSKQRPVVINLLCEFKTSAVLVVS